MVGDSNPGMTPIKFMNRINKNNVPKNGMYFWPAWPTLSWAWSLKKLSRISKICCSLPGRSTESRRLRTANTITMIKMTNSSIVIQLLHGCVGSCRTPTASSTLLAGAARNLLKSVVVQTSTSTSDAIDHFVEDLDGYRDPGHQQSD